LGYALGYHQGARGERLAWESTLQVDLAPHTGTTGSNAAWVIRHRFLYTNPHGGLRIGIAPGLAAVNRPDPRIYRQFEHALPLKPVEHRLGTELVPEF
jgi:hypothetical protein